MLDDEELPEMFDSDHEAPSSPGATLAARAQSINVQRVCQRKVNDYK